MRKNIYLIITFIFVLILLFILMMVKRNSFSVEHLNNDDILSNIDTRGASILYTKELTPEIKKKLKSYYESYKLLSYNAEMSLTDINDLLSKYSIEEIDTDTVFILFMNGEPVDVVNASDDNKVTEKIEKHLYNIIPASERAYKVLSDADQYIRKVNSKEYTIAVFGVKDCTYCDLYLPVINNIAKEKNIDIYYFNRDEYDEDEYEKIMALDFEIPAKCTTTGYSTSMSKSFPKPMTIITKSGEFVDCIRGYVTEEKVLDMLKEYKIVRE